MIGPCQFYFARKHPMKNVSHFTTRRGFIAASGFGGISLYGLWAAYGAAQTPWALLGLDQPRGANHAEHAAAPMEELPAAGAHSAHGSATGPSAQEFSRLATEFADRYRMPDGSVYPRRLATAHPPVADPHAGHDMAHMPAAQPQAQSELHSGHAPAVPTSHGEATAGPAIDVLMVAGKWYYLPNVLRLDAGQPYRFKMMAMDVAHGASIQFGQGGRMMRLQAGRVAETELTFLRPGRYFMHCTVYCGDAHDRMQATLEVV